MTTAIPSRLRRWLRAALVEIGLVMLVLVGVSLWQVRGLASGQAPPFAGVTAAGEWSSLEQARAGADGRPLLVHFWASWCGVCALVEDDIDAVARDWPVLTVAYASGTPADVAGHMRERQLAFPAVVDPDGRIAGAYGVSAVPTSFILDGDGRIRFRTVGYTTGWALRLRLWLVQRL